jgi:tetratricopeptide (TPR) repeat protein
MEIESGGAAAPPDIHLKLATEFYDAGDYGSAATFFDRAGQGPFDDEQVHFRRGYAYSETEQYQKAIREYQTYLTKVQSPRPRAVALTNLGIVAEDLRRGDEAVAYYQKAIHADPTYSTPLNNLAYLYAERGQRLDEALQLADRALIREPKSALIKDTKGWVLYKLGRYDQAVPVLREAAALAPDQDVIRTHLQLAEKAVRAAPSRPTLR